MSEDLDPQAVPPAIGEKVMEQMQVLLGRLNMKRGFHYQAVFFGEGDKPTHHAEKVLADLARFCRANHSTYNEDPRAHALLEGRREVWLRLCDMLEIDSRDVRNFVEVKDE